MKTLILKGLCFILFKSCLWLQLVFPCHQNCFGFLLKLKICLCFQNKRLCGKRTKHCQFFSQQEYFHWLDLVSHFRRENFILTHTRAHTHIWMFMYFALNSGYVTYFCGTCPGHAWSIQLGLYVASTSLLWNKPSVSKYFLLPSPPVTLKPGVSSAVYKYVEVFFLIYRTEIYCMSSLMFSHQIFWSNEYFLM